MRRAQPEYDFHLNVVALLRLMLGSAVVFFHVPNGGLRNAREAGRLKAMGTMPGIPDIAIIDTGRIYWLEFKSKRGTVSEAQKECHSRLRRSRSPVAIVKTIDDVLIAIKEWGIAVNGTWSIPGSVSVSDKEIGGAA